MNKLHKIITLVLLIISLNLSGQNLKNLDVKDLIDISKEVGLDSALSLSKIPVYHISKDIAQKLVQIAAQSTPSSNIENFLVEYALQTDSIENIGHLLVDYFDNKRNLIKDYKPDRHYHIPKISHNSLFALIENSCNKTEELLIETYENWKEKTETFQADYINGMTELDSKKKIILTSPFQDCNYNCYSILLALDSLNSSYFDKNKLDSHREYLSHYYRDGFNLHRQNYSNQYEKGTLIRIISLEKDYNSIADVQIENQQFIRHILTEYLKSECWQQLIYYKTKGYLDVGCVYSPKNGMGALYRLELIKDKLKIYEIQIWIS